jgi:hypothetical protein
MRPRDEGLERRRRDTAVVSIEPRRLGTIRASGSVGVVPSDGSKTEASHRFSLWLKWNGSPRFVRASDDAHYEIDVRSTDIVEPGDTIRISRRLC